MIEIIKNNRSLKLRESLFWDVNISDIDAEKFKHLIIERVISRGNLQEFKQLVKFYSIDELKRVVVKIGYLDGRTLNFISTYLDIPKKEFLCYRKRQSAPAYWNS